MAAPAMRYPVLLFDLFRTILLFTRHAPTGQVKEPTWRPAMQELRGRAQTLLGDVEFQNLDIARQTVRRLRSQLPIPIEARQHDLGTTPQRRLGHRVRDRVPVDDTGEQQAFASEKAIRIHAHQSTRIPLRTNTLSTEMAATTCRTSGVPMTSRRGPHRQS